MKKWLIPIILLTVIGCGSSLPAAGPSKTMINQANTILLAVNDESEAAYQNFKDYLTGKDYAISDDDNENRTLKTDYKLLDYKSSMDLRINASVVSDSTTIIKITGRGYSQTTGNIELANRIGQNSPANYAWIRLVQIAKSYPHQALYFGRNLDERGN